MSDFSIILVTYNRFEALKKLIEIIDRYDWKYSNFLIVNNSSTDETKIYLDTCWNGNNKHVIHLEDNIGHGAAIARGCSSLLSNENIPEYFVFLEDDSIPNEYLPKLLVGNIRNSNFDLISSEGLKVKLGKRIALKPKQNEILKADFCLMDGAIIKTSILQSVGLPLVSWFMMFDDFEYCYRIRKAGYNIGIVKNNFHQILHMGGEGRFSKNTLWRGYYQSRNHVLFLRKHFTLFLFFDFCILQVKRFLACFLAKDWYLRISLRIKGIIHGIAGVTGKTLNPQTLKFDKR